MNSIYVAIFSSVLLGMATASAQQQPLGCSAIVDKTDRLACYDAIFGKPDEHSDDNQQQEATVSETPALDRRLEEELTLQDAWFAITPHRTNYILPFSYNANSDFSAYDDLFDGEFAGNLNDTELKLQISLKTLLWPRAFGGKGGLWFAYTQQAYWQLYSNNVSAPFRETNYEPELFWQQPVNFSLFGLQARKLGLGIVHQSNGRARPLSRSWNRVFGSLLLERGDLALWSKAWWRIPDDDEQDDNPNIERYMGQMELGAALKRDSHTFAAILRNNLRTSDNKSGLQLDWSFPLASHLRGYAQLYTGYGENLIDGDNYQNRFSIGLMLTDWL